MRRFINHILDILTRILRVDVRYFARGGAWLSGGQFAMSGMAMLSAIAFANLLPEETFGQYRFILSIVGILSIASLSGMDTALFRAASRGFERTLIPTLKHKILFSVVGSITSFGVSIYYFTHNNTILAGAFVICAFFIPLKDSLKLYDVLLQARKHFGLITLYRIATQVISLTTLVLTMLVSENLLALLIAYFAPVTIAELYLLVRTLKTTPLSGKIDSNAIRYGYHLSFLRSAIGIAHNLQTVMLFHFLGPVSVALFYFAQAPTEQARALIGHTQSLLFPKTSKDSWHVGTCGAFIQKILPFLGIIALGTITFIITAPLLYTLFFPTYTKAVIFSQWYAPTILITALNTIMNTIISSKGSVRTQYVLSGIDVVLQFATVLPLIYFFGIPGAIGGIYIAKCTETLLLFGRLFIYPHITHTTPL